MYRLEKTSYLNEERKQIELLPLIFKTVDYAFLASALLPRMKVTANPITTARTMTPISRNKKGQLMLSFHVRFNFIRIFYDLF